MDNEGNAWLNMKDPPQSDSIQHQPMVSSKSICRSDAVKSKSEPLFNPSECKLKFHCDGVPKEILTNSMLIPSQVEASLKIIADYLVNKYNSHMKNTKTVIPKNRYRQPTPPQSPDAQKKMGFYKCSSLSKSLSLLDSNRREVAEEITKSKSELSRPAKPETNGFRQKRFGKRQSSIKPESNRSCKTKVETSVNKHEGSNGVFHCQARSDKENTSDVVDSILNPCVLDEVSPYVLRFVQHNINDFRRYLLETFVGLDSASLEYFESMINAIRNLPLDDTRLFKNVKLAMLLLFSNYDTFVAPKTTKQAETDGSKIREKTKPKDTPKDRTHVVDSIPVKPYGDSRNYLIPVQQVPQKIAGKNKLKKHAHRASNSS